jgi:hypothetical protein
LGTFFEKNAIDFQIFPFKKNVLCFSCAENYPLTFQWTFSEGFLTVRQKKFRQQKGERAAFAA